ncbi:MAG: glycosyltransferase 2 family protein [Candidatus Binatota bacterium]|jgi:uncharacterized protein (TIRG00374 family)|nr:glycosyltransferase 2 family protein [Candidatus Binatota bacterium]
MTRPRTNRVAAPLWIAAGAALLAGLAHAIGLERFTGALASTAPERLAPFLVLTTSVVALYALRWKIVHEAIDGGSPLSLGRLFRIRAAGQAAGTLLPPAVISGDAARIVLAHRSGLSARSAALGVAIDRLLELSANAVAGPVYVAVFALHSSGFGRPVAWIAGGMAVGASALALFYLFAFRGGRGLSTVLRGETMAPLRRHLEDAETGFRGFLRTPAFRRALLLSLAIEVVVVAEFHALFRAFGVPVPLPTVLASLVGLGAAYLAPVPAGLGTLEATQVGVVTLGGGNADLGLAVGLLIRLRETLWLVAGGLCLYAEGASFAAIGRAPAPRDSGNTSAIEPNE